MLELLMIIQLSQATPVLTAQVQPCIWPNRCAAAAPVVAQIQPCIWPNRCAAAADIEPCVWPKKCSQEPVFSIAG